MVAIAGDRRITLLGGHVDPRHHRFLADVEMAEAADQAHAVHLAGLLLETADQQHIAEGPQLLVLAELRNVRLGRGLGRFDRGRLARHELAPRFGMPHASTADSGADRRL